MSGGERDHSIKEADMILKQAPPRQFELRKAMHLNKVNW